jgi:prepilin peptidase CpaA
MIEPILLTLVGAAMIAAAVYDAATLTIPNWISLVLLALFPAVAFIAGLSWVETGIHFAVGFGALAVGVALFAAGVIGGGDAKLFAAISLYVGAAGFAPYVFAVTLAGGVLAFLLLTVRGLASFGVVVRPPNSFKHLAMSGAGIPYGIAIAAGGLLVLPATRLFMNAAH